MAQLLIVLGAIGRGPGFIPSTHMVAHNHVSSSSRGLNILFCLPWAPGMCTVHRHRYVQTSTHTHKRIKILSKTCLNRQMF